MKTVIKIRIAFKTLGCRLNQYETDSLVSQFNNSGFEVVDFKHEADAYIVNSCTVTNLSDKKSRKEINKAIRINKDAVIILTGCMAANYKESLEQDENITYVVDNEQKNDIFTLLDSHFKGEVFPVENLKRDNFGYEVVEQGFHTRSFTKIQDGCDNFCTFCIVPFVRGRAISRPWIKIKSNIEEVLRFGYKEIVLTGVNIGRYKHNGLSFEDLVEKILVIPGDFRVRISSIEPEGFGEKLFELFSHSKLMPHLHLCIQSGSDKMLKKMRRTYPVADFRQMVKKIRRQIPDFNFTTDLMVGFPGESEDDFKYSLNLVEEFGFSHIHTFKYSMRKRTKAERFPDQIPEKIKTERSTIIRELAEKHKRIYRSSFIGENQNILVEKIDKKGVASGYGEYFIPIKFMASEKTKLNNFVQVKIIGIEDGEDPNLIGDIHINI